MQAWQAPHVAVPRGMPVTAARIVHDPAAPFHMPPCLSSCALGPPAGRGAAIAACALGLGLRPTDGRPCPWLLQLDQRLRGPRQHALLPGLPAGHRRRVPVRCGTVRYSAAPRRLRCVRRAAARAAVRRPVRWPALRLSAPSSPWAPRWPDSHAQARIVALQGSASPPGTLLATAFCTPADAGLVLGAQAIRLDMAQQGAWHVAFQLPDSGGRDGRTG